MNLWCDRHRDNHRLTPGHVERVVYALQGLLADAEHTEPLIGEPEILCPLEALRLAGDVEGYAEHVGAQREARLETERARKPQLAGGAR